MRAYAIRLYVYVCDRFNNAVLIYDRIKSHFSGGQISLYISCLVVDARNFSHPTGMNAISFAGAVGNRTYLKQNLTPNT